MTSTTRSCWAAVIPGKRGSERISPAARSDTGKLPARTQARQRRREVHRDRVVDAGADALGVQPPEQLVAVGHPDHVQVPDVLVARRA